MLDSAYSDLEVIVSDDASTDDTAEIVRSFDDERVRLVAHKTNVGVPANWNRALKEARGEFIGLLNHDDLYGPFWLTFVVHALEKHRDVGWVATAHLVVDEQGRTLDVISKFPETRAYSPDEAFPVVATLLGLGPGFVARREVLEDVGYYDEDAGASADNDLFLRLAARYPLYYSTYPHTAWRLHAGNLTHRWSRVSQTAEGLRMLGKAFRDPGLPDALRRYERDCYAGFYRRVIWGVAECFARGDVGTALQLIDLLREDMWRGCQLIQGAD